MRIPLFFLLFCTYSAWSQTAPPAPPPELAQYFKSVNLAARAIYTNDFAKAASHYEEAFRHKASPFYADLKNAIIVNSKCGNFDKNNALLKRLLEDKHLDTVQMFLQLPRRIFDRNNLAFIRKQAVAPKKRGKFDETLLKEYLRIFEDYQDAILSKNFNKEKGAFITQFVALYRKRGFLTEDKIGCFTESAQGNWWHIDLLMNNFIKHKSAGSDTIMQILKLEFEKGNIPPSVLANSYDCARQNFYLNKPEYNFQNEMVAATNKQIYRPFVVYTDSLMTLINTNRIAVGLDSFHVAQKQFICGNFCEIPDCTDPNKSTMQTVNYISIPDFPYGLIKYAAEKDKIDLGWYLIDTRSMAFRCDCEKKQY